MANYDLTYEGPEVQDILDAGNTLEADGYIFCGVATPSTNPGTPTEKVYYQAKEAGTYTNFGGAVLAEGLHLLIWNGSAWSTQTVMCGDGGVFDISVYKSSGGTLAKYADLAAALDGGNNIPASARKGGMSIKYVQTSDNKYVQYRLMSDTFDTIVANWQGVDSSITAKKNLIESQAVCKEFADMRVKSELVPYETLTGYRINQNIGSEAVATKLSSASLYKYNVIEGKTYAFSARQTAAFSIYVIYWIDANNIVLYREYISPSDQAEIWEDVPVTAPDGATKMWMNVQASLSSYYNFSDITNELIQVEELRIDVNKNKNALAKTNTLTAYEITSDVFVNVDVGQTASLSSNTNMKLAKYNVVAGKLYVFNAQYRNVTVCVLNWLDANSVVLKKEYKGTGEDVWTDVETTAPDGATEMWMNVQKTFSSTTNFREVTDELIQSEDLQLQIENMQSQMDTLQGNMKVVINGTGEMPAGSVPFYIRTAYNSEKDIIITHIINENRLITFQNTYIGDKSLTDALLMSNTYLVSSHTDSTGPLRSYIQYWHLFAQHGYPVPYFANSVGMTSADVGAEWKDQLDRHYKIGKVTDSYIWLLPIIYQNANGHYTRDWHSTATSTTITSLTHVSGGSYTQPITVSSISQEQLRPIMEVADRKYIIDGNIINEPGIYYANELKVSETEIGYDPATINDWFGGIDGQPNLIGAQKHAIFTYNYNYKGAQCSVNTTIHCLREAKGYYGGTQQQFFFDNGDYKAMFMIPKAATRDGIELDKPFNSPSSSSTGYSINRSSSHLKDINDPVDRQIGMLHNPTNDTYLVGIAAGLSLVKGDTVKNKRNQICLEGSLLLSFSPSNTNKFYVSGINTSVFESGYYPAGYFKEVDYYVSYFDPAENEGQVYWYKDGSRYVIYCHCQSVQNILAINVPVFMDGLKLSIVEKTDNTELLSDTIANGKFFVNYNTADANYIVLIAE